MVAAGRRLSLRPQVALPALAVLLLAAWSWFQATGSRSLASLGLGAAESRVAEAPLPRIGLERLGQESGEDAESAVRDPFQFGKAPPPSVPQGAATMPSAGPTPVVEFVPPTPPPPPTLPPFGVKFIGSVEQKGVKIAILMSEDRKEVLTGREGDTVANRLKIVKIGFESVDVQDIGSDRVRRIPLKGN